MDSSSTQLSNKKIIPIIAVALVSIAGVSLALNMDKLDNGSKIEKENISPSPSVQEAAQFNSISPHNLIYGKWTGEKSNVYALSLEDGRNTLLAELPNLIKKVSVYSNNSLLYINNTDGRDHGTQIVEYNLINKESKVVYSAEEGLGIDDYVLSNDRKYLAVWEVAISAQTGTLSGGKSRVYSIQLDIPTKKHLLYDEQPSATATVHYPRAITNSGEVYLDTFLPNSGAGWAYGMSAVNYDGASKQELPQMPNGTYSTQPVLSPDGQNLLFAGNSGNATENNNGNRITLVQPNTIELFNTRTKNREKLPSLNSSDVYLMVKWDQITGNIIYSALSKDSVKSGLYSYDINTKTPRKLDVASSGEENNLLYVASIANNAVILGKPDTSPSSIGNLGETYAAPFTSFVALSPDNKKTPIIDRGGLMQFIAITPSNYFQVEQNGQSSQASAQAVNGSPTIIDNYSEINSEKDSLQLYSFFLKSWLVPVRSSMQSGSPMGDGTQQKGKNGTCAGLAWEICSKQMYGDEDFHTNMQSQDVIDKTWNNTEWNKCRTDVLAQLNSEGTCIGSPLYLYGKPGDKVYVKIHTPVYNDTPKYSNGYSVTLLEDGLLQVGEKAYESIEYDYQSAAKRLPAPSKGSIVSSKDIKTTLRSYAQKLGLNKKETEDLVDFGVNNIQSPYVFISFYDQRTSEQILPISFDPQPDKYINIVFYFRKLNSKPNLTSLPPVFPEVTERKGFTAVEISGIVE